MKCAQCGNDIEPTTTTEKVCIGYCPDCTYHTILVKEGEMPDADL